MGECRENSFRWAGFCSLTQPFQGTTANARKWNKAPVGVASLQGDAHVQEPIFKRPSMASPQEKEVYVEKKGKVPNPQIFDICTQTYTHTTTENTAKNEANEDARFISFVTGLRNWLQCITIVVSFGGLGVRNFSLCSFQGLGFNWSLQRRPLNHLFESPDKERIYCSIHYYIHVYIQSVFVNILYIIIYTRNVCILHYIACKVLKVMSHES